MRDRGGMAVLTVVVGLAISSAMLAASVPLLDAIGDRQRAQNAADAAALAGVSGGRVAAERLASANDATVVEWRRDGDDVIVTVIVDRQRATARATNTP